MGGDPKEHKVFWCRKHGIVMLIIDMTEAVTKILKLKLKCNGPLIYV